jgi:5-methylcytosine-specific restriction endonuclease McrA
MRKYRPAKHVDHIVPKALGGTDDEGNLQAICVECHQQKTLREAAEAKRGMPQKSL